MAGTRLGARFAIPVDKSPSVQQQPEESRYLKLNRPFQDQRSSGLVGIPEPIPP
jgi:hypothetical protein